MPICDAIDEVGSIIYGMLGPPIFRQCGYILFCNSYVRNLKVEIQKLKDATARVQRSVDESRSAGEFIHEDVLTWLSHADHFIESGNKIIETSKVNRVLACVPDPKDCYRLGRKAKRAIPVIQHLCSKGLFDKVSYHRDEEQLLPSKKMSTGNAISVGSIINGILRPPIFRQCGYILFCKSHVKNLKNEIQKLKDAAARVQYSIDESRSAGEFIHEDDLTWLNRAEQRIESGNRIIETNKVNRVLACVLHPMACYELGRAAKKSIPEFQHLNSKEPFDKVSYHRAEEQSLILGTSRRNYVALKSRTALLNFVMEALDDDKIGAVGVYGMGGVGKTTLLKKVENAAKESKKFDGVFPVLVSQYPNLTAIRVGIENRLKRLRSSDASTKVVLILFDDLWKPLDLKDLGVPENNDKLKIKLVITSRNKHLLSDEMSCKRTFSIGELDVEETWRFFAELVSSNVEDLKAKLLAEICLEKCAGVPVYIEALASLWNKWEMDSYSGNVVEDWHMFDEFVKYKGTQLMNFQVFPISC